MLTYCLVAFMQQKRQSFAWRKKQESGSIRSPSRICPRARSFFLCTPAKGTVALLEAIVDRQPLFPRTLFSTVPQRSRMRPSPYFESDKRSLSVRKTPSPDLMCYYGYEPEREEIIRVYAGSRSQKERVVLSPLKRSPV